MSPKCTECRKRLSGRGDVTVIQSGPVHFVVCRYGPCERIFQARLLAKRTTSTVTEPAISPAEAGSWE
jgi:hypothetical protein